MIVERGVERASLRSIGVRAGSSRELPAYHFGSKEALIARLADRAQQQAIAAISAALDRAQRNRSDLTAFETLCVTMDTYLELFAAADAEARAVVVLWGASLPTESDLPVVHEVARLRHRELTGQIRAGQQDGSIRADVDPAAAAVVVMGMVRGAAAMSLAQPDAADPTQVRKLCGDAISAFLRGNDKSATGPA
ncbi:TetR family transcriptional regulator [Parafrankia colletiae]|uniref:TetR family transcriptional regulator n=2 Tax=Parafrankia colletiae TaxID=573497 RepID=A0A1S1Q120_9ACTN|nr:TetR family transcriptional regulator [Parafrankia colletiae]